MIAEVITLNPPMTPMQELNLEIEAHQAEIKQLDDLIRQAIQNGDRDFLRHFRIRKTVTEERLEKALERRGMEGQS